MNLIEDEWILVRIGSLSLAFPLSELLVIHENDKLNQRNGLACVNVNDWWVPVYAFDPQLRLSSPVKWNQGYIVTLCCDESISWGVCCDEVSRFDNDGFVCRPFPTVVQSNVTPLSAVMVKGMGSDQETWVYTSCTSLFLHFLQGSKRDGISIQSGSMVG